jgi:hypothetical protein
LCTFACALFAIFNEDSFMKKFVKPIAFALFVLTGLQLTGCSRDQNYKKRMALMESKVSTYLGVSAEDVDFSMDERGVVLKYPHSGGCVGMGSYGASDCKEELTICFAEEGRCTDRYELGSGYSYVVPEFNIMFKMVLPVTKYGFERHIVAQGADIPSPQREKIDAIRHMAEQAYRTLPVFKK